MEKPRECSWVELLQSIWLNHHIFLLLLGLWTWLGLTLPVPQWDLPTRRFPYRYFHKVALHLLPLVYISWPLMLAFWCLFITFQEFTKACSRGSLYIVFSLPKILSTLLILPLVKIYIFKGLFRCTFIGEAFLTTPKMFNMPSYRLLIDSRSGPFHCMYPLLCGAI